MSFWNIGTPPLLLMLLLVVPVSTSELNCEGQGCFTREILNVWSRFAHDNTFDNQNLWNRMNKCLLKKSTNETNLWNVSDNLWRRIIEIGIAGGSLLTQDNGDIDPWPGLASDFIEYNPTPLIRRPEFIKDYFPSMPDGALNITVVEPCNTVSNIAYIWTMVSFCEHEENGHEWALAPESVTGLVQAYNLLWIGSAYAHASSSKLGFLLDNEAIRIIALLMHQGTLQSLPYDSVLHDVSDMPAKASGQEIAIEASRILSSDPISGEWWTNIRRLNSRDYETSFSALITTTLTLIFPSTISVFIAEQLGALLLSGDELVFILNSYEPSLRQALDKANVQVNFKTRLDLSFKLLGVGIKLIYAFVWQEQTIGFPYNDVTNILGALATPRIIKIANKLTQYDGRFKNDFKLLHMPLHVYPGDRKCRLLEQHSKWHEQSANGLFDLALLSDDIARVIGTGGGSEPMIAAAPPLELRTNWAQCLGGERDYCVSNFDWSKISAQTSLLFQSCVVSVAEESNEGSRQQQPMIGKFIECMLVSIIQEGNTGLSTTSLEGDSSPDTIDQCLVENNCIGFNGVELDIGRLRKCIGIGIQSWFVHRPPCSSMARRIPMSICLFFCRGDSLCSVRCLQRYADFSPWIDTSLSCLTVLFGKANPDEKQFEACVHHDPAAAAARGGSVNEFQSEVVRGLSSFTSCSVHSCNDARNEFTQGFGELNRCTKGCTTTSLSKSSSDESEESTIGMLFSNFMPKGMACAFECTFSNVGA